MKIGWRLSLCRATWLGMLLFSFALCVHARDAFVMLSGGYSPFDNNYSQYLQARAVLTFFERNYPADSVWVFFGAGNVEGRPAVFGDVRREVQRNGLGVDSWLPGFLHRNRPARRDVILRAFREEILPTVVNGGTLYLFVGDHGSQTRGERAESHINLWTLAADSAADHGWRTDRDESLGVSELRDVLLNGLGKGRVVFCMTQCHAGGFHYLSVPRQMPANPKWFLGTSKSAETQSRVNYPRVAGFTATDERSLAAGCDASPDPESWEGYERYFPEQLLGWNLFTLDPVGKPLPSFAQAHVAATLTDATIDKPYSTSEQYLERWASLIESTVKKATNLTSTAQRAVGEFDQIVDGAIPNLSNRAFRKRREIFELFTSKLILENPEAKELLMSGSRKQLEEAIGRRRNRPRSQASPQEQPSRGSRGGGPSAEARKAWNETVRTGWKAAIDANKVTDLTPVILQFEHHLMAKEAKSNDYFSANSDLLDVEVFWESGYSNPQTVDLSKAESIAQWAAERRKKILAWGRASGDEAIRTAAERLSERRRRQEAQTSEAQAIQTPRISRRTAAERTLFYRRVLGAWTFLLAMDERPALARVRELTELENMALPRPHRAGR